MKKLHSYEEGQAREKLDFSFYLYSLMSPRQGCGDGARWGLSGDGSRSHFFLTLQSLLLILPEARKIKGLPMFEARRSATARIVLAVPHCFPMEGEILCLTGIA